MASSCCGLLEDRRQDFHCLLCLGWSVGACFLRRRVCGNVGLDALAHGCWWRLAGAVDGLLTHSPGDCTRGVSATCSISCPSIPVLRWSVSAAARPARASAPGWLVTCGQGALLVVPAVVGEAVGDACASRPATETGVSSPSVTVTGSAFCGWSGPPRFLGPASQWFRLQRLPWVPSGDDGSEATTLAGPSESLCARQAAAPWGCRLQWVVSQAGVLLMITFVVCLHPFLAVASSWLHTRATLGLCV